MKEKVIIGIISTFLHLTLSSALAAGATEKVTGSVTFQNNQSDTVVRCYEITAHESTATRPAKGNIHWWAYAEDNSYVAEATWEVIDTKVEGNEVWVKSVCTGAFGDFPSSYVGWYYYVHIVDNSTPGNEGDVLETKWSTSPNLNPHFISYSRKSIVAGNFKVHTRK